MQFDLYEIHSIVELHHLLQRASSPLIYSPWNWLTQGPLGRDILSLITTLFTAVNISLREKIFVLGLCLGDSVQHGVNWYHPIWSESRERRIAFSLFFFPSVKDLTTLNGTTHIQVVSSFSHFLLEIHPQTQSEVGHQVILSPVKLIKVIIARR